MINTVLFTYFCFTNLLSLAGMELTLFLAAHMVLQFVTDNTPVFWLLVNSACTASRLSLSPAVRRLRVGKKLGGGIARTPTEQRDFPYCMMFCSTIKAEGNEEEERGCFL